MTRKAPSLDTIVFPATHAFSLPPGYGTYDLRNKMVKASTVGNDACDVMKICAHEIGHFLWYEKLSDSERERYCAIYAKARQYVSRYAFNAGPHEDFAESFMAAMSCNLDPELLPKDRQQFFIDIVKPMYHGSYGKTED